MTDDKMSAVRASKRVSIAWGGRPAREDTDTVVLTINDYSLDLRVFTEGPDTGGIDWAIVAFVHSVPTQGTLRDLLNCGSLADTCAGGKPVLRWDHIIDSRGGTDTGDEGAFEVLPNGDVLETGSMFNPARGKDESYEEIWRRFPVTPPAQYCVLERIDGAWGDDAVKDKRAFLGRFGPRALGVEQDGSTFRAYRDELKGGAGWSRVYEFDVGTVVPPVPVEQDAGWAVGDTVSVGEGQWVVRAAGTV